MLVVSFPFLQCRHSAASLPDQHIFSHFSSAAKYCVLKIPWQAIGQTRWFHVSQRQVWRRCVQVFRQDMEANGIALPDSIPPRPFQPHKQPVAHSRTKIFPYNQNTQLLIERPHIYCNIHSLDIRRARACVAPWRGSAPRSRSSAAMSLRPRPVSNGPVSSFWVLLVWSG